jgi:hypothetical protein
MLYNKLTAAGLCLAIVWMILLGGAQAQSGNPSRPQPQAPAQHGEKCLRALDGSCTNPMLVEAARQRAIIVPSVRVSYYGTPAGTIGGYYIPFERLFQDNPVVFGLPTNVFVTPCCITRSK